MLLCLSVFAALTLLASIIETFRRSKVVEDFPKARIVRSFCFCIPIMESKNPRTTIELLCFQKICGFLSHVTICVFIIEKNVFVHVSVVMEDYWFYMRSVLLLTSVGF